MTITLTLHDGRQAQAAEPYPGADHVRVAGLQCECSLDLDLQVAGGRTTTTDEAVTASAACTRCHGSVGTLTVHLETLFGPAEDERVVGGPWKVY